MSNFFTKYPGYFVRLSGSAVESLFSQYKYNAGGKLDAANYSSARAASSKLLPVIIAAKVTKIVNFQLQPYL